MRAGVLVVDIAANVARLAQDMAQAKGVVAGAMNEITRSVNVAKTALGALGIGLGAGYFGSVIKGAIDAADHLNDLSKATSITVEGLAGLKLAAKQSGGDLDGIAQAINKLSVNMGKDAQKFKDLGVSAKDPLEAFKQLSDVFVAIQDPQQRAAVMAAALGKSWASAAPLLAEGGDEIGKMVAKGALLSGVTKAMAEEADKFNDQMVELNTTLGSATTKALGPLLPGMNEIATAMRKAAEEGGLLLTIWVGLGGVMANLLGMTEGQKVKARLSDIGDQLEVARKQLQAGTLNPAGASSSLFSFLIPDIKLGEAALAKIRETVDALEKEKARLTPEKRAAPPGVDQSAAADAQKKAAAFLTAMREAAAGAAPKAKTLQDLLIEQSGLSKSFYEDWNLIQQGFIKGKLSADEAREALGKLVEKQGVAKEAAKQQAEAAKALTDAIEKQIDKQKQQDALISGFHSTLLQQNADIEFETRLLGLSTVEREKAIAVRKIDMEAAKAAALVDAEQIETYTRLTDKIYSVAEAEKVRIGAAIDGKVAREAAQKASEDAAKRWKDTFERRESDLTRTISEGLMRGFEKGAKSGAQVLIDTIKNSLKTAVFEPVIRAIVSPVSGAVTAATMGLFGGNASAAGGIGGASNLLSFGNSASSMFGGSQAFADIGNFFSSIGSVTEAGSTFGLMDAIGGFASAHPLGIAAGVLGATGLLGGLFGGGDEPAPGYRRENWLELLKRDGQYTVGSSEVPDPQNMPGVAQAITAALNDAKQFDAATLEQFVGQRVSVAPGGGSQALADQMLRLLRPAAEVAQAAQAQALARAMHQATVEKQRHELDIALMEASGNAAGVLAARRADEKAAMDESLRGLYDQITATQDSAQASHDAAQAQQEQLRAQEQLEASLAGVVRSLPESLGIRSLEAARMSLATSESVAPMERFATARSYLTEDYGRAVGGDLSAVQAFPQLLQSALSIGRDVFASGPQFAEFFAEGGRMLEDLRTRMRSVEADIVSNVPFEIKQAAQDQIGEIRRQTKALVLELQAVRSDLRSLQATLAP